MKGRIAILGWGSLLWDLSPKYKAFLDQIENWQPDGPELPLEFSRISSSRGGALTLVIDPEHGAACRVSHALSRRGELATIIEDLRVREDCPRSRIASLTCGETATAESPERSAIRIWGKEKDLAAVVWTGLGSNFEEKCGSPFTIAKAIQHLRALHEAGEKRGHEYVSKAPPFVETPLRAALREEVWFN